MTSSPLISVVLNTARGNCGMIAFPTVNHLDFTLRCLAEQTFRNFEVIIADLRHPETATHIMGAQGREWRPAQQHPFPIYHVPVRPSHWTPQRRVEICRTKNSGIAYAEGKLIVNIDDGSFFGSWFLDRFWHWYKHGCFANALHKFFLGDLERYADCRFKTLDQHKTDHLISTQLNYPFHTYGYLSYSREAILEVNGYDEMLDASRQLEDVDVGERLKMAGYKIVIDRHLMVGEQEQQQIEADNLPERHPKADLPKDPYFTANLWCNSAYYFTIRGTRSGKDLWRANAGPLSGLEQQLIRPCQYFQADQTCWIYQPNPCIWPPDRHLALPEAMAKFTDSRVFSLKEWCNEAVTVKERYRING